MRRALVGCAVAQIVVVILQFYLATFGAFQMPRPTGTDPAAIGLHAANGLFVIPAVSLVATIVAALAKVPGKLIALSAAPLLLSAVQMLVVFPLAGLAGATVDDTPLASLFVYGLHAVVGLGQLWAVIAAYRAVRRHTKAPVEEPQPQPV
ncbi:DUF6220 domain-containing protein [Nonomuraea sp. CA-143628]|uniref:DUF6220 domain-containing protein n=1 Tax=Nonomuraea sp. CA-143628 TaxID=3239997 RepID=UPI003D90C59C